MPKKAVPSAASEADAGKAPTLKSLAAELAQVKARLEVLEQRFASEAQAPIQPEPATACEPAASTPIDPLTEIHLVLRSVFEIALSQDTDTEKETPFDRFRGLVHSTRKGTPLLERELLAYKWQPLQARCRQYLDNPEDPASFRVVQVVPAVLDGRTDFVKVFLRADKRMPPPVSLRRDELAGGAFRVDSSSL